MRIKGIEFTNAREAIQQAQASQHGKAITVDGKVLVVEQAEADRLASAGIEFAYLVEHQMPDGKHRIMTIPVND